LAASAIRDDVDVQQAEAAGRVLAAVGDQDAVERWCAQRRTALQRYEAVLAEVKAAGTADLAALTVVSRELRAAVSG
jgi:NAD-specific glutamate dehydrogenase